MSKIKNINFFWVYANEFEHIGLTFFYKLCTVKKFIKFQHSKKVPSLLILSRIENPKNKRDVFQEE